MAETSRIKVCSGSGAVLKNPAAFADLGERVLIVTSGTAGMKSGALADVRTVLDNIGIQHSVCDSVKPNPDLDDCRDVARIAREFGADALVGIGGGSPLDVVKIVSILAINDLSFKELISPGLNVAALPFVAIPTTAGSGSETTRYAVVLDHDRRSKRTIANDAFYPKAAFLDERYTEGLPLDVTRYTALDALSHLIEGYISNKATKESDAIALEGLRAFKKAKAALIAGDISLDDRGYLLCASHMGGRTIDITRSNAPHVMGYQLTYKYGIPHGMACAVFLPEFLKFNAPSCDERIEGLLAALDIVSLDVFGTFVRSLVNRDFAVSDEEIERMVPVFASYDTMLSSPRKLSAGDMFAVVKNSVGKK
jgi:alcohol dehydrogenase class IV